MSLTSYMPTKNTAFMEEVKSELDNVIGLEKVKQYILDLENDLIIQDRREKAGLNKTALSKHMIFVGNPGTGKTTMARIIAKYFKAMGILSTGQLREVSRNDLIGQYLGHTAKQTSEVIRSALGGVLFIDEAYSLSRDKNDVFGMEAIDTLVKAMEDYREDLVIILAGYRDEMEDFLKVNSGLKSRFPHLIEFEDYSPSEMVQIALKTAVSKGYRLEKKCMDPLERLFERCQIKGKNDSGNGRLVRNIIEQAILHQSKRLLNSLSQELDLLEIEDFNFESYDSFDLDYALSQIIGLESVKDKIRTQKSVLIANEKRRNAGIKVDVTQSLNMIFSGNPGTGKTSIARIMASMFKEMGLLKSGHLVETDQSGLVAEYAGQTAIKTEEKFRSALGGVLFIDEAYSLNSGSGYGQEAINTLVKLIEDYRGEIVVILAGYKNEMVEFMKSNSGLESRFPIVIDFPDYTVQEMYLIALQMISGRGFSITEKAKGILLESIGNLSSLTAGCSGNGRMVRNQVETILRNQSARIASAKVVSNEELTEILPSDVELKSSPTPNFDLEEKLAAIIGLEEVKDFIRSLYARLRMQNERKKMGIPVDSGQSLHMIFKGNPGTGKTMVARMIAELLHEIGAIRRNHLVETDRSGLVAGYVGQTAIKTNEKIKQAMNGVLFIDEAYSLAQGGSGDFGREAIDTLVKSMDDNRERLVVILAGYSDRMEEFLGMNPGLKSRFPNIIEFPDYNPTELMDIAMRQYNVKGYELSSAAKEKLLNHFQSANSEKDFGNGRYVRNLLERSVNHQALRLSSDKDLTREDLTTIKAEDIRVV